MTASSVASGGRRLVTPRRRPGRRRRRCGPRWPVRCRPPAGSTAPGCSICTPGPARSAWSWSSRGASSAVFVERDRAALTALRANVGDAWRRTATGGRRSTVLRRVTSTAVPSRPRGWRGPFDIVVADPPYDLATEALSSVLAGPARRRCCWPPHADLIVERSTRIRRAGVAGAAGGRPRPRSTATRCSATVAPHDPRRSAPAPSTRRRSATWTSSAGPPGCSTGSPSRSW